MQQSDGYSENDDQMAADHMMRIILKYISELKDLYPNHTHLSIETTLLTAGILMLIRRMGPETTSQTVQSLAKGIGEGGFDRFVRQVSQRVQ